MNTTRPYIKHKTSILALCQETHMSLSGAAEPFPLEHLLEATLFLSNVLANWEDSRCAYDDAVKQLVRSVLLEATAYLEEISC